LQNISILADLSPLSRDYMHKLMIAVF